MWILATVKNVAWEIPSSRLTRSTVFSPDTWLRIAAIICSSVNLVIFIGTPFKGFKNKTLYS
jgi:hypothetical protein